MSSVSLNQHALNLALGLGRLQAPSDASSARISSGQRIDRPAADVAGTGLGAKLDGEQARIDGVQVNLQNGVSRMQVTSGHLDTISRVLTRMGEIAALSTNATQGEADRALYQKEFSQLQDQLRQSIGGTTAEVGGAQDVGTPLAVFNDESLFGPESGGSLAIGLQADEQLALPTLNFRAGPVAELFRQNAAGEYALSLDDLAANVTVLNDALDQAASARATVGAVQSRLELAANVALTARTNNEAALSAIRDTDLATETTLQTRLQILSESHTAMLAQARDMSSKLLPLLSRN